MAKPQDYREPVSRALDLQDRTFLQDLEHSSRRAEWLGWGALVVLVLVLAAIVS